MDIGRQRYGIDMSIAISNGQTKATIMRINEFTQVTHDKKKESIRADDGTKCGNVKYHA